MAFDTNHNNNFVEIFAIGNELLVGQVLDTNTHWLVRNLTAAGAQVRRAAMIRDDYDDIAEQLLGALKRGPKLIVTTGGLGPTDDDMTYRAISRALNLELYEDANALEMIRQRYAYLATIRPNFNAELNEARRKMALFPRGSEVLANNAGAAPALALQIPSPVLTGEGSDGIGHRQGGGFTTLVSLPGVPVEMKDIYTNSLQPVLARTIGPGGYMERNIVLDLGDESRIAAALEQVQALHPTVYIKSRGQTIDGERRLTVVLSRGGSDLVGIRDEINTTEQEALAGLKQLGYTILKVFESE